MKTYTKCDQIKNLPTDRPISNHPHTHPSVHPSIQTDKPVVKQREHIESSEQIFFPIGGHSVTQTSQNI